MDGVAGRELSPAPAPFAEKAVSGPVVLDGVRRLGAAQGVRNPPGVLLGEPREAPGRRQVNHRGVDHVYQLRLRMVFHAGYPPLSGPGRWRHQGCLLQGFSPA